MISRKSTDQKIQCGPSRRNGGGGATTLGGGTAFAGGGMPDAGGRTLFQPVPVEFEHCMYS